MENLLHCISISSNHIATNVTHVPTIDTCINLKPSLCEQNENLNDGRKTLMTWTSLRASHQYYIHIHGLVQDCSNSIAKALELLQSYTKPSI